MADDQINNTLRKTERGFGIIDFIDDYGRECSLQKSSSAEDEKVWLGMDKPELKYLVKGEGWKDFQLPEGIESFSRMHLTREHVAMLLPYLQKYLETGELS